MMGFGKLAVLGSALALLSACEVADNAVQPSMTGTPPGGSAASTQAPNAPVGVIRNADGSVTVPPLDISQPDQPTGTAVGQKVTELKADLARLQDTLAAQTARQQSGREGRDPRSGAYQWPRIQKTNVQNFRGLLRSCRQRPCGDRAAEQSDAVAPFHCLVSPVPGPKG